MLFMIYVLMYSWLMREHCTYPRLDITVRSNDRSVRSVKSDLIPVSSAPFHLHKSNCVSVRADRPQSSEILLYLIHPAASRSSASSP